MAIDRFTHSAQAPRSVWVLRWTTLAFLFGQAGIFGGMLQSVFIAGGSLALAGGLAFLISALIGTSARIQRQVLCIVGITLFFFLMSAQTIRFFADVQKTLPLVEVGKASVGMFFFFITLVVAPAALDQSFQRRSRTLLAIAWIIVLAFLLDWTGALSLKSLGVVSWFDTNYYAATFDERPSGLYSEPSWHALAACSLAYALLKRPSTASLGSAAALVTTVLLSGSSTGILLSGFIVIQLCAIMIVRQKEMYARVSFALGLAAITLIGLSVLAELFSDLPVIQKLFDPLGYGSGEARFSQPWPIVSFVWDTHPFFGLGMSYITERLMGQSGFAVLPFVVFIEMGLLGVIVYAAFFVSVIRYYGSSMLDIAAAIVCLMSLGLPYSPFQALMLAFFLFRRVR